MEAARKKINKCLKKNYFYGTREYPYKNVKPRIIVEKFMARGDGESLKDYKVMCFGGVAKLIEFHANRFTDHHTQDFYDVNWNKTEISQGGYESMSTFIEPKPECLDLMISFSQQLTKNMAHCRVDWYVIDGKLYFGELTFYDGSGFEAFDNYEDELMLGSWIDINKVK
jgi:hypothetical protein